MISNKRVINIKSMQTIKCRCCCMFGYKHRKLAKIKYNKQVRKYLKKEINRELEN
jgi:hypothetical protein